MRKNNRAFRYCRLASKYCRIAGVTFVAAEVSDIGTCGGVAGPRHYTIPAVLVLALDSSTRAGSVAVVRADNVLALIEGDASRTHAERVPEEIERALVGAGVDARDLDLLVVSSGPGAFTGLRIGLAAIQG